jgi:hypothetical protein
MNRPTCRINLPHGTAGDFMNIATIWGSAVNKTTAWTEEHI